MAAPRQQCAVEAPSQSRFRALAERAAPHSSSCRSCRWLRVARNADVLCVARVRCSFVRCSQDPHPHAELKPAPKIGNNILDFIGNTPLVRLNSIPASEGIECEMLAKCEYFNAGGSVKDRIGKRMILDAEASGRIKKGDVLIEPTSGQSTATRGDKRWGRGTGMGKKMKKERKD